MGKVRVELVQDFGPRKGHVQSGVIVETNYDSLLKAVQNKLKLNKKEIYAVTMCCINVSGMRALTPGDLSDVLQNGARVVVCLGESSDASQHVIQSAQVKMSKKVATAVDQLCLVAVGNGGLSARGRPNPETLAALQRCKGLTAVVTLLRGTESQGEAVRIGNTCKQLGLKWCHAPLAGPREMGMIGDIDVSVTHEDLESFRGVRHVSEWLVSGSENVLIHCAAGLHRTGIFLYVLLRELGYSAETALQTIQRMRQETYNEFIRLGFQKKAEGLFALVREGNLTTTPCPVQVIAERANTADEEETGEEQCMEDSGHENDAV
eukprot:TRINITY_DN74066_c0_g1_i1.p1 TRINITY_DN74066_c0_g1~~TRINITY_DN74066_c0_g1_i1.p1  ORF type:complete len:321 (-),score=41.18 TRINITY_DN74066_c0_g1_i1:277-1239(-)